MKLFNMVVDATKVWVTSDWHISHLNYCRGTSKWDDKNSCRDFNTIEEMDETIINRINGCLNQDSILINLGDILFGDKSKLGNLTSRINCKEHHYILGNHDHWMIKDGCFKQEVLDCFDSVQFYLELFARMPSGEKHRICFNHFSKRVWHDSHKGSILCWGHSHSSLSSYGKSLDVGIDTTHGMSTASYEPYRLDSIINWAKNQPVVEVDHHTIGGN